MLTMTKNTIKNIALIMLLSITAFSMFKDVTELQAKNRLQDDLTQVQGEYAVLAKEKQKLMYTLEREKEVKEQLLQKNANLKLNLKASRNKITHLFQNNAAAQNDLENTKVKFSVLKAENKALIDSRRRIYLQNEEFKTKLSSVVELKKAIRDLRSRKNIPVVLSTEGNQGYLTKDGLPTTTTKIKIEVVPAKTKE